MSQFHDITMKSITGDDVNLSTYSGQFCLIVNVASAWGLTPQYAGLRTLHNETDDLNVLGFPCNQFGAQEPGSDEEILDFVTKKYDVNFPMFSKIEVNGENACELYKLLKSEQPGEDGNQDLPWNFTKFLVDGEGSVIKRFNPQTTPEEIKDELGNLMGS